MKSNFQSKQLFLALNFDVYSEKYNLKIYCYYKVATVTCFPRQLFRNRRILSLVFSCHLLSFLFDLGTSRSIRATASSSVIPSSKQNSTRCKTSEKDTGERRGRLFVRPSAMLTVPTQEINIALIHYQHSTEMTKHTALSVAPVSNRLHKL